MKKFHLRPIELHHEAVDEFAHLASGTDLALAQPSTVTSPSYADREAVEGGGGSRVWRYKGRYLEGTDSHWLSVEEARELDVPAAGRLPQAMGSIPRGRNTGHGLRRTIR